MKLRYILCFLLLCTYAFAQEKDSYYLPQNVSYDAKIPTPQAFLGYQVGEQHVSPYEQYAYWRELAKLSNRFKVEVYGKTYENRELLLVTITSPQNHQNLGKIQEEHLKLVDSKQSGSLNLDKMPSVIWMGYSVHGNEASGTNSALLTAYYLAAAQGPSIDSLLNETVILVDPCINADGGNRFASWVNQNKGKTLSSDPNGREFKETWPGGRTNHYWFDLNRDWLYQQLPESKGRLVKFYDWRPNILTDHHEMGSGSTFFFQPGVPERTHPMTPQSNIDLTIKFGKFQAAGMDGIGSYYYTQENYDDFYYGKGSTLPDVNGSIGILFEQASSRGHLQRTSNGELSFPFTIKNQFTATLSTLKAGKTMRVELLKHMKDFYAEKSSDPVKAYVFGGSNDPVAAWEMVNMLQRNKIDVYKLAKDQKTDGKSFAKDNAFVVPMAQAQHRLIKSLFEKRTTFKDSAFYDVSAWTIPLCMNVPYAENAVEPILGEKVNLNEFPVGKLVGKSNYSYVFEWDSYFAPRAAYELIKKGYKLKVATAPFEMLVDGKTKKFDYGSIQLLCNGKDPSALLETLAKRDAIEIYAASTGLTPTGIDFGSEKFRNVNLPRPLLITGQGVDYTDAGEIWHLLDTRVNIPLSMVDIETVNRIDLGNYSHVILASGSYGGLSESKIANYVKQGGILVALGDAAEWAANKKISSISLKPQVNNDAKEKRPYASQAAYDGALETAGTIFETKIDPTHPMCYGYKQDKLAIFKVNNLAFEDTQNPYDTPVIYTKSPLMAGYVHPKNYERFKNSPVMIAQTSGSGRIISISDNPNFRAFWYGTNKLFLNTLFFGNLVGAGRFGEEEE